MRTDVDLRIAELASRQHGAFSRAQVGDLGGDDAFAARRLRSGRWGRMWPGVYRLAGTPPSWEQTLVGSWLAGGDGAVVTGRAAGTVWGFPKVARRLELAVPSNRFPRVRGVSVHRGAIDAVDVVRHGPLLVVTPTRAIVHLAASVPEPTLGSIVDHCFSRRLTDRAQLVARLDAIGRSGRPGVAALRRVLDARPSALHRPHEEFERRLAAVIDAGGIEPPVYQHVVDLPSGRRVLDAAWPSALFALEADSYLHHSSLGDWARDHPRNAELIAAGWRILPVTWPDLVDTPDVVLSRIDRGLRVSSRIPTESAPTSRRVG